MAQSMYSGVVHDTDTPKQLMILRAIHEGVRDVSGLNVSHHVVCSNYQRVEALSASYLTPG